MFKHSFSKTQLNLCDKALPRPFGEDVKEQSRSSAIKCNVICKDSEVFELMHLLCVVTENIELV